MHLTIFLIILIIIIIAVTRSCNLGSFSSEKQSKTTLTPTEREFYDVLEQVVGDDITILAKIKIADVLKKNKENYNPKWLNSINQIPDKYFNFVLCRSVDLSVICVIKLDEVSANTNKVICDKALQTTCDAVGLKLYRFIVGNQYDFNEISALIFPALDKK